MTKLDKIKALVAYELEWAINLEAKDEIKNITEYIACLFDGYTGEAIDELYNRKFND